ncbi:MAG: phosphomannose isomerase type II C-terminal cupin domain [Elusimicrobia bacterium]|nr:phosphomannose isomerase type II C-terminal cupin domain [Elusimicrobiota bacterium]
MARKTQSRKKSDKRPWGGWEILAETPDYKVKRITVHPGQRLSYQKHRRRKEHWFVAKGSALATLEGRGIRLELGDSMEIPLKAAHRVANTGAEDLVLIEVALGGYLGEDDIIRLEDDYGRAARRPAS